MARKPAPEDDALDRELMAALARRDGRAFERLIGRHLGWSLGFADVQARTAAIGTTLQQAILRALPSLTQDDRRAMVQALARRERAGAQPEF